MGSSYRECHDKGFAISFLSESAGCVSQTTSNRDIVCAIAANTDRVTGPNHVETERTPGVAINKSSKDAKAPLNERIKPGARNWPTNILTARTRSRVTQAAVPQS